MTQQEKKLPLICFLITSLCCGGAQMVLAKLVIDLRRRGWPIKIISMLAPDNKILQMLPLEVEVVSLDMHRGIPNPQAIIKLVKLLRTWRPYILHSHMVHANLLGRIVSLFVKIQVVVSTAHSINEGARWREIAYRVTDSLADVTTNVSKSAVEKFIDVGAVPRKRIRFIPNGMDTNEFAPNISIRKSFRNILKIRDAFVWVAVGRLDVEKDYESMIRAFSPLAIENRALLLIAGEGPLQSKLKELISSLEIEPYVRLLGVRQDIPELMNAADAYVMSSLFEGLPMVLLEAAATSLPIVATEVGGNGEIVVKDRSGILIPSNDIASLTNAMMRVMNMTKDERSNMGCVGRDYIVKNYSHDKVIDLWEKLYWEFLNYKILA